MNRFHPYRTLVAILLGGLLVVNSPQAQGGSGAAGTPGASGPRVLHFPAERSLGSLMVRPARPEEPIDAQLYWVRDQGWEVLGPARGDVAVPAGSQVFLRIHDAQAWRDLSPLAKLEPDDLYSLALQGSYGAGPKPGDLCMTHIAHLTGLHSLDLKQTSITGAGLKHLVGMKNLRELAVPAGMDDQGMAYVGQLTSLRSLYFKENRVTNAGLAHLTKLHALEELELGGRQIGNDGLAYLAELPRLRYLILWGGGFSDAGLARLKNVRSLETLNLGALEQITDAGLARLSDIPQLKDIDLYHCKNITNAGLTRLKKLGLFGCDRITDESLRTISQLHALENLSISYGHLTISGLKMLNSLTNLKNLDLDEVIQDNSGLDLSGLTSLEDLMLSLARRRTGSGVVSSPFQERDLATFGKLTRLKRLQISHAGATNTSLAYLTGLSRLERLSIGGDGLTDEGLVHLAGLSRLNSLTLSGHFTDAALGYLQKLPDLGMLEFFGSGAVFSQAAVTSFQRSRPRLIVFRGFETDYARRPAQPLRPPRR